MKPTVYIESSVISYYANNRSRDLVCAGRQIITHRWWQIRLKSFAPFISTIVLEEIAQGKKELAMKRLEAVKTFTELMLNQASLDLAEYLIRKNAIPRQYPEDSLHIAIAAIHGMDYLVTWNFAHINNAERKTGIEQAVRSYGFQPSIICTPEELMGDAL